MSGEKILNLVESRGQICVLAFILFRTFYPGLENNRTLKWISDNFPVTLTYVVLLKFFWILISMYGSSPIYGRRS